MAGCIKFRRLLELVLLTCCWTQVALGSPEEKTLTALYVQSPMVVDGNLDEAEWSLAHPPVRPGLIGRDVGCGPSERLRSYA